MLMSIIQVTSKRDLRGGPMSKTKVKLSQSKGEKTSSKKGRDIPLHRHLSVLFLSSVFLFSLLSLCSTSFR